MLKNVKNEKKVEKNYILVIINFKYVFNLLIIKTVYIICSFLTYIFYQKVYLI